MIEIKRIFILVTLLFIFICLGNFEIDYNAIFVFLDNTFFGTIFAGLILSFVGFSLYKEQKKIENDIFSKHSNLILLRDLYAIINISSEEYLNYINTIDKNSPYKETFNIIYERLNSIGDNTYEKQLSNKLNENVLKINEMYGKLKSNLDLINIYTDHIENLSKEIPKLNFYLGAVSVLKLNNQEDLMEIKNSFNKTIEDIKVLIRYVDEQLNKLE